MKIRVVSSSQNSSLNNLVYVLGKVIMFLYIITAFITASDAFPEMLNSLMLYAFVFLGLANLVLNKGLVLDNIYVIWYALFCFLSLIWMFIGKLYWPNSQTMDTLYAMIVMLLLAAAFSQFLDTRADIKKVGYAYLVGAVWLFIILAATGQLNAEERLGTSLMGNANKFAMMYMSAIVYALWMALNSKNKLEKILVWAAIIACFYALLLSGGRKYILTPVIALYIMLLLRRDKKGKNHAIWYTTVILVLLIGVYWLITTNEVLYNSVGYRMEQMLNIASGEGETDTGDIMRQKMINLAVTQGFNSPIWGHGFDTFKYLGAQELNRMAYSHNNWTELWYNYGLIGLIAYYWLYVRLLKLFWKRRKSCPDLAIFAIAGVISVFVLEVGVVSYYSHPTQILLCVLTTMHNICVKEEKEAAAETEENTGSSAEAIHGTEKTRLRMSR